MSETITRLSTEESRTVLRRRKRGNVLLMLVLFGFVGAMFVLSFTHMQMEGRPAVSEGVAITDQ